MTLIHHEVGIPTKGGDSYMSDQEKRVIQEISETDKYLADNDRSSLLLAKNSLDILKGRCDMVRLAAGCRESLVA